MGNRFVILPSALTWAKSATLRRSRFAIRGVPREPACDLAGAVVFRSDTQNGGGAFKDLRQRFSRIEIEPKNSPEAIPSGEVRSPDLVVAPINVNGFNGSFIDLAAGP